MRIRREPGLLNMFGGTVEIETTGFRPETVGNHEEYKKERNRFEDPSQPKLFGT